MIKLDLENLGSLLGCIVNQSHYDFHLVCSEGAVLIQKEMVVRRESYACLEAKLPKCTHGVKGCHVWAFVLEESVIIHRPSIGVRRPKACTPLLHDHVMQYFARIKHSEFEVEVETEGIDGAIVCIPRHVACVPIVEGVPEIDHW